MTPLLTEADALREALGEATEQYRRTSAALDATCRREEAQRPVIEAAEAWATADDAWGYGRTDTPPAGMLDGLQVALAKYRTDLAALLAPTERKDAERD